MYFHSKLRSGILISRYKRFMADIKLDDNSIITSYCPNTGSMLGCKDEGIKVWFSESDNIKRKYKHTWELVEKASSWIGVNTNIANILVKEAILSGLISQLKDFQDIKPEVKYGNENSKIDFLLTNNSKKCFVEVKNVTLSENNIGYFPDAITVRGQKHLRELESMVKEGHRAVLIFCVQNTSVSKVMPAAHIDKEYFDICKRVSQSGVEVYAYKAYIDNIKVELNKEIPVII